MASPIQNHSVEDAERHYRALSQIKDICVISVAPSDNPGQGLFAVVVPDAGELTSLQVSSARERVGELLVIAGCVLPWKLRITNFVLIEEELPRNSGGELNRDEIAQRFQPLPIDLKRYDNAAENSAEFRTVFDHPASQRFLRRLEELLDNKGPFSPNQDLETDLGMDSLTQMQLRIVLEKEFGVEIANGELWRVRRVGDILRRIVEANHKNLRDPTNTLWSHQLRQPPVESLEQRFPPKRSLIGWISFWCVTRSVGLLFRVFFRATVIGRDKLPKSGAMILAPNHVGYLDSPLLYTLLPARLIGRTFFLAFREIFREPPLSRIVRSCRLILTGDAESLIESLRLCLEALGRGLPVCVFPEGIRSTSGTVMRPRPGTGMLACEAQCPIVPILIEGSEKTLSPPHPGFQLCRVRLTIGDPISPPPGRESTVEDYQALADRWREAVLQMQEQSGQARH